MALLKAFLCSLYLSTCCCHNSRSVLPILLAALAWALAAALCSSGVCALADKALASVIDFLRNVSKFVSTLGASAGGACIAFLGASLGASTGVSLGASVFAAGASVVVGASAAAGGVAGSVLPPSVLPLTAAPLDFTLPSFLPLSLPPAPPTTSPSPLRRTCDPALPSGVPFFLAFRVIQWSASSALTISFGTGLSSSFSG